MRISSANIPAAPDKTNLAATASKTPTGYQATEARDSYRKNVFQAQVIDAEYVDLYSPSSEIFNLERSALDSTFEHELEQQPTDRVTKPANLQNRYQLKALETPPPGSYLDIFA